MTRRLLASAFIVALCLAAASPALSKRRTIRINPELLQSQGTSADGAIAFAPGAGEREQLRKMALEWRRYIDEENTGGADEVLDSMGKLLDVDGHKDSRTLVGGFVAMGREWALQEDWDKARAAYDAALELDPGNASAHRSLGELSLRSSGGVGGALGLVAGALRAFLATVSSGMGLLRVGANALLVLVVAGAIAAGGLALVLLAKYNRLLRYGTRVALADRVMEGIDSVMGWALVFLPLMLFLSPPWWAIYWLVVLRPYGNRAERRLCLVGLALIALTPPAYHLVSRISSLQHDPIVEAVAAHSAGDVSPALIADVQESLGDDPEPEERFLLAQLLSAANQQDRALQTYNQILSDEPGFARAIVNRGNINFRRDETAAAIADYKQAVDRDRKSFLAYRNGSIAFTQDLQTDQGREWLQEARRLDGKRVRQLNDSPGATGMVDATLATSEVLSLITSRWSRDTGGVVKAFFSPTTIGALFAIAFSVLLSRRVLSSLEAKACEKCGRAFAPSDQVLQQSSAYCTQCIHLYVKKDGVSPVVRNAKLREVGRWVALNGIITRLFNILVPGTGSLYGNRVFTGVVLLFGWAIALSALLLPRYMVMSPTRLGHADLTVLFVMELALLVVVYLVALVQSLRHSS